MLKLLTLVLKGIALILSIPEVIFRILIAVLLWDSRFLEGWTSYDLIIKSDRRHV
jgi:hypothetical protein